ncbi:FAD-dependent oxidoreductase [Streptomyces sp. NPDC000410]|uniref:NAD(P)/FAD-dependent oxidoreductase n=1 Tax=Streptomyces sp. NPDC000410 TaxID=3154254 RepID=UPI003330687D
MSGQPAVTGRRTVDVLVVGAGPAGLAAATELAATGAGTVEVVDREQEAGGIPRHCHHGGFGLRDLRRPMSGPAYARHRVREAAAAGAVLRTGVSVTGWAGPLTVETTSPAGLERLEARAVVLATGARERPRSARLVPGSRPSGVYTTGELQQAVHLYGQRVGERAVIVGAGPVARAAVGTLRRAGVRAVALVTEEPGVPVLGRRPSAGRSGAWFTSGALVPVLTGTTVTELLGRGLLTGVALRRHDGRTTVVACDTVVFSGDWIPENELARSAGAGLDAGTRGPAVDAAFRTDRPGVFAVGNVLHGVEPAATAALEGRRAAGHVRDFLVHGRWPVARVPVVAGAALRWAAPNLIGPADTGARMLLRPSERLVRPVVDVVQDGRLLHRGRLVRAAGPERSLTVAARWADRVDGAGGPVIVSAAH